MEDEVCTDNESCEQVCNFVEDEICENVCEDCNIVCQDKCESVTDEVILQCRLSINSMYEFSY